MRQKIPTGVSQKVPSPLVGEGQGEGAGRRFTLTPTPLPSRERGVLFVAKGVSEHEAAACYGLHSGWLIAGVSDVTSDTVGGSGAC